MTDLRGAMAYEGDDRSETALARAVHLLTLGAFAWQNASPENSNWRQDGGGSIGSVFFDRSDDAPAPTAKEWVSAAMLANPKTLSACEWYDGEETCLQLLRRLAVDGGHPGCFVAQDRAVRAGAAWLCDFAAQHSPEANKLVRVKKSNASDPNSPKQETEIQRRKRLAKEKAMERMKAQAAKFASMMEAELGGDKDKDKEENDASDKEGGDATMRDPTTPQRPVRQGSFGSAPSAASSVASTSDSDRGGTPFNSSDSGQSLFDEAMIPQRLLRTRPQCIICNDDANAETEEPTEEYIYPYQEQADLLAKRQSARRNVDLEDDDDDMPDATPSSGGFCNTLFCNYEHLLRDDPELAEAIQGEYMRFEFPLRRAVSAFVVDRHPALNTFLEPERITREDGLLTAPSGPSDPLVFFVAFFNLPSTHSIRQLRMDLVGCLVSLQGTITRTSEVRPELMMGSFKCAPCGLVHEKIAQNFTYTRPPICKNPRCKNQSPSNFTLEEHRSEFVDWQKLRVQESSHQIPPGCMPR